MYSRRQACDCGYSFRHVLIIRCIPGRAPIYNYFILLGRFDITSSAFKCEGCGYQREADTDDYVISGFWPGIAVDGQGSYFISRELLLPWYHLQHLAPGVSRNKFIETFESVSNEFNRVNLLHIVVLIIYVEIIKVLFYFLVE